MALLEEKIRAIEDEIRKTQYNKATQHHIGRLKAKIAMLREEAQKRGSAKGAGQGFGVKKSGDATVVLVGFPSVGKSTLLNRLTGANSKVGSYDFTTLDVVPGVMEHNGARIQVLDVPGLIRGAASGKGRGKEVLSIVRSADFILMVIDVFNLAQLEVLKKELHDSGVRLNASPPDVRIAQKERGGITISSTVKLTRIDEATIKAILAEYRMHNCDAVIREDITEDQLIDVLAGNRKYVRSLIVLNKIDLVREDYLSKVAKQLDGEYIPVSADKEINTGKLREMIFKKLDFIRVYMKPQGKEADMKEPLVVMRGTSVGEVCSRLHRELEESFRYAQVWGKSVRFAGQRVGLEHVLADGDVLTIIARK